MRRLVVRQGLALGVIGVALGLALSFTVTRGLAGLLWGVGSFDATTFVGVTTLLFLAMLMASYMPARRATRVDPIIALRAE